MDTIQPEIVIPKGVGYRIGSFGRPWELGFEADALVSIVGLPGAGKTYLLERLAPQAEVLSAESEILRRHGPDPDWTRFDYGRAIGWVFERAETCLASGTPVIVQSAAMFPEQSFTWRDIATHHGRPAHFLYLRCAPAEARRGQQERGRELPADKWRHYAQMPEKPRSAEHSLSSWVTAERWDSASMIDRASGDELVAINFADNATP